MSDFNNTVSRLIRWADSTDAGRDMIVAAQRKHWGHNRPVSKRESMAWHWGATNDSTACGGGIRFLSCGQKSGFQISDARESAIPPVMRKSHSYGDADYAVIALLWPSAAVKAYPSQFAKEAENNGTTREEEARCYFAEMTVRDAVGKAPIQEFLDHVGF